MNSIKLVSFLLRACFSLLYKAKKFMVEVIITGFIMTLSINTYALETNTNMNKETLQQTKAAVFSILLPDIHNKKSGFALPTGTGFFISSNGYFITAAHVIEKVDSNNKSIIKSTDCRKIERTLW